MHRTILRLAFLLLGAWLLFAAWAQRELAAAPQAALAGEGKRVLILYQPEGDSLGTELYATMTANLVGRFGRAELRDLNLYALGDAKDYDALFVLPAARGTAPPHALVADVRASRQPVVWIHYGAQALFADSAFAARQGWVPAPPRVADYVEVQYKGKAFPRDLRTNVLVTEPLVQSPERVTVFATASGEDGRRVPWAVRSGSLFYVLEAPYPYAHEDDRYLVFADLLFEVLSPDTAERRRAMVRLEDIGPEADPTRIRMMADLLASEGVPFAMSVYDTYRDPDGHYTKGEPLRFSLRQRPRLVRALEHAVEKGGVLVAHGHTHQTDHRRNPYARVSGGDYEFFAADLADGAFDLKGPLPDNGIEHWRARFAASRAAWRRAGLPLPRVFTTPHYAASLEAYQAAGELFAARYERVLYFAGEARSGRAEYEQGWETQFFPFEVVDSRGDFIIPENLGYSSSIQRGGYFGRGPERLIASAERNLVVRDGFASFFHHWYESPEALRRTVRGLKALGYSFVSPSDVIRDAPVHAPRALAEASPLALASAAWVGALPDLSGLLLAGLLLLIVSLWLGSEAVLDALFRPRRRRRRKPAMLPA
jgi:uncharacterized protein YdaL